MKDREDGKDVQLGAEVDYSRDSEEGASVAGTKKKISASEALARAKSADSIGQYLREMKSVPLLDREGEVRLAKEMERGERIISSALSSSPALMRVILRWFARYEEEGRRLTEIFQPEAFY